MINYRLLYYTPVGYMVRCGGLCFLRRFLPEISRVVYEAIFQAGWLHGPERPENIKFRLV